MSSWGQAEMQFLGWFLPTFCCISLSLQGVITIKTLKWAAGAWQGLRPQFAKWKYYWAAYKENFICGPFVSSSDTDTLKRTITSAWVIDTSRSFSSFMSTKPKHCSKNGRMRKWMRVWMRMGMRKRMRIRVYVGQLVETMHLAHGQVWRTFDCTHCEK